MSIFCIADAATATAASVVICISYALFFFRSFFFDVGCIDVASILEYLPTFVHHFGHGWTAAIWNARFSHPSIFYFHSTSRCAVCLLFESQAQRKYQVKRPALQRQLYIYIITIILCSQLLLVLLLCFALLARLKRKKEQEALFYFTSLCFVLLYSPRLVSIYYIHIKIGWWKMTHTAHTQCENW